MEKIDRYALYHVQLTNKNNEQLFLCENEAGGIHITDIKPQEEYLVHGNGLAGFLAVIQDMGLKVTDVKNVNTIH